MSDFRKIKNSYTTEWSKTYVRDLIKQNFNLHSTFNSTTRLYKKYQSVESDTSQVSCLSILLTRERPSIFLI